MNKKEVMAALKAAGSEQTRKTYARHGFTGPMFGVSFAELGRLQKKIGTDHELGLELWDTGNFDARNLACKILDPEQLTARQLDRLARDVDGRGATVALCEVAAWAPKAKEKMEKWIRSKDEWIGALGWHVLSTMAGGGYDFTDAYLGKHLRTIEKDIHKAKNRTRYAMNSALISIGMRGGELQKKAVAAAKRIGVVEVDHGDTACKTPDAVPYIKKAAVYYKKRMAKKKVKKSTKKTAKKATRKTAKTSSKEVARKTPKGSTATKETAGKSRRTARVSR